MNHAVDTCPLTKSERGLNLLHEADDDSHAAEIYSDCSIHKIIINTGCTIKITAPFSCIVAWLETAGVSLHPYAQSSNGTHGHASAPTLDIVGTESIMVPSNFYN